MLNLTDLEIVTQAFENMGDRFGGSTKTAFRSVANEIRRLKRVQEDQEHRATMARLLEASKGRKIRGEPDPDDDIPF